MTPGELAPVPDGAIEPSGLLVRHATATSLNLPTGIGFEDWSELGDVLQRIESGVMWWIGDWWRYGERSYGEAASAAAPTGYSAETCRRAAWVADRIEPVLRRTDLTFSHHQVVAALEPAEQDELLSKAQANRWSVRELNAERQRAIDPVPIQPLDGTYPVLLVDPPWRYEFAVSPARKIENQYPTMTIEDLCSPQMVERVPAAADAVLFCWATSPKLVDCLTLLEAWRFDYRTCLVWVKDRIGMGYHARQRHELLLVAKRGVLPAPDPSTRPDSVIEAPRGQHSAKPQLVYELIERMYPSGGWCELFARHRRAGWASWGNEL